MQESTEALPRAVVSEAESHHCGNKSLQSFFHPNSNFVLKRTDTEGWKLWVESRRQPSGSGRAGTDASGAGCDV